MTDKNFILFHRPHITDVEVKEMTDTVESGWWTTGPKTFLFEKKFNEYIGSKNTVVVNSWTAAAHLALAAIGLKEGDEVIVPAYTFTATAEIVCYFKAIPVIVDVQPGTLNIDPAAIEKAITSKTKAIIPVHFGGQPADLDEITEIARRHNLIVIEDAAHALPSSYKGKRIGTISDMTCFSFYATKPLATGEGGALCTANDEYAEKCSILKLHGINRDAWKRYSSEGTWYYEVVALGYKYNFTDLQASLGLSQLKKVEVLLNMRKQIAKRYDEAFLNYEYLDTLELKADRSTSYHLYPVFIKDDLLKIGRNEIIEKLKAEGIGTSVHFIPLYRHLFYRESYNLNSKDFPVSENAFNKEISLPIWPGMTIEQIEKVIFTLKKIISENIR